MYLTTVGTSRKEDPRDAWHAGWWPIKSAMWIVLVVVPFLIPSAFIQLYGEPLYVLLTSLLTEYLLRMIIHCKAERRIIASMSWSKQSFQYCMVERHL
jgi:hypothetical protein